MGSHTLSGVLVSNMWDMITFPSLVKTKVSVIPKRSYEMEINEAILTWHS